MFLSKLIKKLNRKAKVQENDLTPSTQKVIVVGASGYVGKATLAALTARHSNQVQVFAGVRNPEKFDAMEKVTTVAADMGDKAALTQTLKGFDSVYLVVPGHENRTQLAINGLQAAKQAGVNFVLVLSVATAGTDSIFGQQFAPIEVTAKTIGINYAIVRLPLFIDNNWAHVGSIKGHDAPTFYDPRDPTKRHTPVAVSDVGKASADILANPAKHHGKTYTLVAPAFSLNDVAAAFSKALGKKVTHTQVGYKDAKDAFMGMGFPEWQVDGIMEVYHYIDNDSPLTNVKHVGDIEAITGEKPLSMEAWVAQNAAGFM